MCVWYSRNAESSLARHAADVVQKDHVAHEAEHHCVRSDCAHLSPVSRHRRRRLTAAGTTDAAAAAGSFQRLYPLLIDVVDGWTRRAWAPDG